MNDQPPGIEEGDIDTIPDSTSAAQRVGEFLEEFAEVRAALEGEDWHGAVDADTIRAILDRDR